MTLARDLANIISGGFTASDVPANPVPVNDPSRQSPLPILMMELII